MSNSNDDNTPVVLMNAEVKVCLTVMEIPMHPEKGRFGKVGFIITKPGGDEYSFDLPGYFPVPSYAHAYREAAELSRKTGFQLIVR